MQQLFYPGQLATTSSSFAIARQVTVFGMGLVSGDTIRFEMLYIPTFRGDPCECPPLQGELPQVSAVATLTCCGEPVEITADRPFVVLDAPQGVLLRAVLNASDPTSVVSWLAETNTLNVSDTLRGCPCAGAEPQA
jgi:hypothetical protein